MTVEEALKNYQLRGFVYKGELLNFGRKNKNFDEWYENHKGINGKIGIWNEQVLINTMSFLVFYINKDEEV